MKTCVFAAFLIISLVFGSLSEAFAEKRIALVIGNDRYSNLGENQQLRKALNDAEAIGDHLASLGFEVIRGQNLGRQAMIDRLADLTTRLQPGDTAAFFFAGHGVAIGGSNFLLPSDVPAIGEGGELRVRGASIAEADIIAEIQAKGARVGILIIDACRDNPFARPGVRSVGLTRGLADAKPARGIFTIYSAGIGQTALDEIEPNDPNRNSVFTRVLLEFLNRPGLHLSDLAIEVRERVAALALKAKDRGGNPYAHEQTPAYYDQTIGGRIYLAGAAAATPVAAQPQQPQLNPKVNPPIEPGPKAQDVAAAYWRTRQTGTCGAYEAFALTFKGTFEATLAQEHIKSNCGTGQKQAALPLAQPVARSFRVLDNVSQGILNLRGGPGTNHGIITAIPAGSTGITIGVCRTPDDGGRLRWCEARWRQFSGWLSTCCIVDASGVAP